MDDGLMPEYRYKDANGHKMDVVHPMAWSEPVICSTCGAEMWRVPQPVTVTWGGLAPSGGDLAPEIQQHLATADEQRDRFARAHEEHEGRNEQDG
jgi:hypothetical protein